MIYVGQHWLSSDGCDSDIVFITDDVDKAKEWSVHGVEQYPRFFLQVWDMELQEFVEEYYHRQLTLWINNDTG